MNMFGLRLTIEAHARSKNGQPPQSTTGVEATRPIQFATRAPTSPPPPQHLAHRQREDRDREQRANPETTRHVHQLGIRRVSDAS